MSPHQQRPLPQHQWGGLRKLDIKPPKQPIDRIDHYVKQFLSSYYKTDFSSSEIKKIFDHGHVFLNRKRCRICSKPVFAGAKINLFFDPLKVQSTLEDLPSWILYEDDHFILLNKPAGLSSQSTLNKMETNLYDLVQFYLTQKQPEQLAYAGLIHRLDKHTSGVILFTKSKVVNGSITQQFRQGKISKTYLARVHSSTVLPESWVVENKLFRQKTAKGYRTISSDQRGKFASTQFKIIQPLENQDVMVEAAPKTGRTHQIRCHLSEFGAPIIGDSIYGGRPHHRLCLHAFKLGFHHPKIRKNMSVEAPLAPSF